MLIKKIKISELKHMEDNPRKITPAQLKQLENSLDKFGYVEPIVWNKRTGNVVSGHQRLKIIAKNHKPSDKIDVVIVELDEYQERALNVAMNKISGDWDDEKLEELLLNLKENNEDLLQYTGFDEEELLSLLPHDPPIPEERLDEVPEVTQAEVVIKKGDLIELGRHRVLCGDATDDKNHSKLTQSRKMDILLTDPPYGISVVGKTGSIGKGVLAKEGVYKEVINDDKDFNPSHLMDKANSLMIFGANFFSNKLPKGQWIVWDKNRPDGTSFSQCELMWTNGEGVQIKKYAVTWFGMVKEGESGTRFHPTQKPIKLMSDLIEDYSEKNQTILDLYLGSGSTLIACENTGRVCYGMEIDPYYCQVITQRWIDLTGHEFVKINGETKEWNNYKKVKTHK